MDNSYRIKLGVELDTSDIISQINAAEKKVDPITIKVDAETKELTQSIQDALKTLSKGGQNTLTLDTSKFEGSIADIKSAVIDLKKVLGSLDDVIDEQVQNLMNQYGIVGKKGSKAFEEIKQAIVEYRASLTSLSSTGDIDGDFIEIFDEDDAADIRKVTDALTSNMRIADQSKEVYEDLVRYVKEINNSGHKVYLPDTIRQEYGEDFSRMRSQLGKAFTTSQSGVDFESWVMELNDQLGNVIDLSHGAEAAFGDLVNKVQMGRDNSYLSGDDLLKSGMLDIDDMEFDVINALGAIEEGEKQIAQASAQSANAVVQSEERKQQAYRETADAVEQVSKIKIGNTELDALNLKDDIDETDKLAAALSKLKSVQSSIDNIKIGEIDISKGVQEIQILEQQLESLSREYNETVAEINGMGGVSATQLQSFQNDIDTTNRKIEQLQSNLKEKIQTAIGTNVARDVAKAHSECDKLSNKSDELRQKLQMLDDIQIELETEKEHGDIQKLSELYTKYLNILKDVNAQIDINKRAQKDAATQQKLVDDIGLFQNKIDSWLTKNSAAANQFGAQMLDLKVKAEGCDRVTLNHLESEFKQIDKAAEAAGKKAKTFGDSLKAQFSKYSSYFSIASLYMYAEQAFRSMFEQVKLIDTAMTELKKVTDETDASYNKFLSNAASRSKELGTTIDGLVSSTADFARLGYSFEESQGLAEVANVYAVVGDEIDGVEGATESLVSTLAAFKDELSGISDTDFAMDIIDKFNEVSNNFAISSGGIGEAMQRSASSLRAANNTIDESIALITAANTVVQDPTVVGTAFKTISMRIRGAKTELEEAGLETEGMVESTATLRAEIEALTGVDIMKND